MNRHRVGRLDLRVRSSRPNAELSRTAQAFTRAVLERCGDKLEARAPGRRFFVRRLPLRWTLDPARWADPSEVEGLADQLASDVAASAVAVSGFELTDAEMVVFDDDAHWRAAHWHARAQGRDAWYFASLGALDSALSVLLAPAAAQLAAAVLARLVEQDALLDALAALPVTTLEALEKTVAWVPSEATGAGPAPVAIEKMLGALLAARPASMSERALAFALHVHARVAGAPDAAELAARALRSVPEQRGAAPSRHTELGGLFFLLNPLLELRVGELLYAACLPEREFLRAALATLLDDAGRQDPALELCSGVAQDTPLVPAQQPQQEEVVLALLDELVEALPRRGLASFPAVGMQLCGRAADRLLLAQAMGSPFVLFAWPAPTPQATTAGLAAFLARWPRSEQSVWASPALVELDRSGRLLARREPLEACERPSVADGPTAALLLQLAGATAYLLSARAGGPSSGDLAAFAALHLAVPADVVEDAETLVVTIPAEFVQITQRRAGLDRDPGWVPWLSRYVRFVFVPGEEEIL